MKKDKKKIKQTSILIELEEREIRMLLNSLSTAILKYQEVSEKRAIAGHVLFSKLYKCLKEL